MNPDEIEKLKHCFVYNSMENIRNLEVIKAMADIIGMGDDGRLYFKFTVKDNDSFKIKRSKSGSAYVNTSKLFSMNNIDKNEYVGRYNLIPVNDPKYKGFYALEWVADPTLKKKEIKEFEKEVEKAVGEDEKDLQRKLEFKD